MGVILDVNVLPRQQKSRTRKLHDAFFSALKEAHPELERMELDLSRTQDSLPTNDEWDVEAKFSAMWGDGSMTPEMANRWQAIQRLTDQLHAADMLVLSCAMWNFSIPWPLKRWIDAVMQPRLTFEVGPNGFTGLLAGRTAVVLVSRDGAYPPGSGFEGMDFQLPYLKHILGFLGYNPIHTVIAEPMAMAGPDVARQALEAAVDKARELARSL